VQRSEQLLSELERLSAELTQVKGEKEATMEARGAKERDLEQVDKALKRVRERVDSLGKSVRTLERVITQLCER
jgi:septal ring factor EnvC (AmiA/AmiB activator)